uniref:BMA-DHS-24 n=1 Tax=Brugia malayi TaxID=6279 RepID=A0A0J9XYE8_BRUMA|nr:BMA-DHS-24 [Brugia malayi]
MYVPKWMGTRVSKGWMVVLAVSAGHDLVNKTYIVVGASSGIGKETAKELAMRKAKVIMACRNNRKCIEARRNLVIATKNMEIYCRRLNLEDFDSVREFALKLNTGKIRQIDGIVYSAATAESSRQTNKHHIERTFATNHLGPFLLTSLLYDRLRKQSSPVRLVFLNTSDLKLDELNFDDLNSADLMKKDAYYQSKLALALFVKSLSEKVKNTNLRVTMVDPGYTRTDLFYRLEAADNRIFFIRWCKSLKSDAVRPVLYALVDEKMEGVNGTFMNSVRSELPWHQLTSDEKILNKLWITSAKWTETGVHLERLQQDLKKSKFQEKGGVQDVKVRTGWFSWF